VTPARVTLPTAAQDRGAAHDTPNRKPLVAPAIRGVAWIAQRAPSQCSASGTGCPAASTSWPTATHVRGAGHDTLDRTVVAAKRGAGVGVIDQAGAARVHLPRPVTTRAPGANWGCEDDAPASDPRRARGAVRRGCRGRCSRRRRAQNRIARGLMPERGARPRAIAFVAQGQLELVDLRSCRVRALASRAAADVQFSADGRWMAYAHSAAEPGASPAVVSVSGGTPHSPLGTGITAWWWAPAGATLFGVNRGGQLVQASPDGVGRVAAHGARTFGNAVARSPDGRRVASDSSGCLPPGFALDTIGVSTGERRVALSRRHSLATFAGWSPDGRWLLYWAQAMCSASLSADGWPLDAVPVAGGHGPTRAVTHMLLYPDYLTWCGTRLIAAAGPSRETQLGSALVATGPPSWHQRTIAAATRLSWVSPACAPSGSVLAAAAGRARSPGRRPLRARRAARAPRTGCARGSRPDPRWPRAAHRSWRRGPPRPRPPARAPAARRATWDARGRR
jgi:hypothetical protein